MGHIVKVYIANRRWILLLKNTDNLKGRYWSAWSSNCSRCPVHHISDNTQMASNNVIKYCENLWWYRIVYNKTPKIYPVDRRKTRNINYLSILIHFYCTDLTALNAFSCWGGFKKIPNCRFIKIFSLHTLRMTDKNEIMKR